MGLLGNFAQHLGLLGAPPATAVTPPSMGGFNAPGYMPFPGMQTGQPPAPTANSAEHPGGILGFVQQQLTPSGNGQGMKYQAPPATAPDMSQPTSYQNVAGQGFADQGSPVPGQSLRPISGLQQLSGYNG